MMWFRRASGERNTKQATARAIYSVTPQQFFFLDRLTDLDPVKKLLISNRLVHHTFLQLSTSSFENSHNALQGTTEYNPTKRHTEYMWSGWSLQRQQEKLVRLQKAPPISAAAQTCKAYKKLHIWKSEGSFKMIPLRLVFASRTQLQNMCSKSGKQYARAPVSWKSHPAEYKCGKKSAAMEAHWGYGIGRTTP